MTNKVIILDVDGPMLSSRAWVGYDSNLGFFQKWDPIAVRMIKALLKDAEAKLVISSTWASKGKEFIEETLHENGIDPKVLHENWITPRKMSSSRHQEVNWWIEENSPDKWVSFDDDPINLPFAITVSFDNGILYSDYLKARKILGLKGSGLII